MPPGPFNFNGTMEGRTLKQGLHKKAPQTRNTRLWGFFYYSLNPQYPG